MAKCSLEHGGIQFCWECREYPCPRYDGIDDWDSFVPHRSRQQDIAKVRELGLEAYLAQLGEKRAKSESKIAAKLFSTRRSISCPWRICSP